MITPRFESTDLCDPALPQGIPPVLRNAAKLMRENAEDLRTLPVRDPDPGKDWDIIAAELEATAERIEQKLKELG